MKVWMFVYNNWRTLLLDKVLQIPLAYRMESVFYREIIKRPWALLLINIKDD